jgi:nuclear pore complex protein Nup62
LKNKTLDEIIVRWSSDLSKYQKEFQDQAAKVASWDRLLVENGEQLQKLYVKTAESVRNTAEVEKQLSIVENQQAELESWLDKHEYEVDEMFNQTVIPGEGLQGPDQERERTYKLAEKLTERLDEMGKDLSSMIQEINTASASLSKTSKTDDPVSDPDAHQHIKLLLTSAQLSKIVRVLNGHLSQLQWIDQNAAQLQAKVAAVQKETQQLGSQTPGRYENDATDNLFRSYVGSRR